MDKRIVFFLLFTITVVSTLMVAAVCVLTKQTMMDTVLYSLAAMWIMGIVSQLLLQNLYHAIVRPMEQERLNRKRKEAKAEVNLDEIEEIDQAAQIIEEQKLAAEDPTQLHTTPTVGVHVEQKG